MKKSSSSYTVNRKGYHLVIDAVPAYVCSQCHEPFFEETGVQLVQALLRELDQKSEALQAVAL